MSTPKSGQRCLACGQVIPVPAGRVCGDCRLLIGRHDKWRFGPEGKPVHKDCTNRTLEMKGEAKPAPQTTQAVEAQSAQAVVEADPEEARDAAQAQNGDPAAGCGTGSREGVGLESGREALRG